MFGSPVNLEALPNLLGDAKLCPAQGRIIERHARIEHSKLKKYYITSNKKIAYSHTQDGD